VQRHAHIVTRSGAEYGTRTRQQLTHLPGCAHEKHAVREVDQPLSGCRSVHDWHWTQLAQNHEPVGGFAMPGTRHEPWKEQRHASQYTILLRASESSSFMMRALTRVPPLMSSVVHTPHTAQFGHRHGGIAAVGGAQSTQKQ
jgi:hypothetical protein